MIEYLNNYLIVGVVWLLLHELMYLNQPKDLTQHGMNNGMRVRLILFWPITLSAWIIGFIEAARNHWNDEEGNI